mmetsp:Transcript_31918/g.38052  ORF Transcript_31918/g.38052 Transcript_31918/m.38052 type:complete len:252 (+) Transcript_31918:2259-3014(+)
MIKTFGVQRFLNGNTRIIPHHTRKLLPPLGINRPIIRQHLNKLQPMSSSTFIIVRIVRGCDFHGSGTKRHIHQYRIGNNRYLPIHKRMTQKLPVQVGIPRIVGMYRHRGITQHSLQPCRRYDNRLLGPFHGIRKTSQCSELIPSQFILRIALVRLDLQKRPSLQFHVFHFDITNRTFQGTTPIPHPSLPIQQSLLIQQIKRLHHRLTTPFIHRKPFPTPIDTHSQTTQLAGNLPPVLIFPLPHLLQKLLSS